MICDILNPINGNGVIFRPIFLGDMTPFERMMELTYSLNYPQYENSSVNWVICNAGGYENAILFPKN